MSRYSTTRRKQKTPKNHLETVTAQAHFELRKIEPLTETQEKVFDAYEDGKQLFLKGYAGTGKSFVALYLALKDLLTGKNGYEKIIILRSAVSTRDQGYLPGSLKEKQRVYELPYVTICNDLFSNGSGYEVLKAKKLVDFTTTSYLRGLTFENSIVIVDECQNMSEHEMEDVITRLGDNTKLIICGDLRQTDLQEGSGFQDVISIASMIDAFEVVDFGIDDIVRSGLVKEWIVKSIEYHNSKKK